MTGQNVAEIAKRLAEPFSASDIEWRVGRTSRDKTRASVLAYVTNRAIDDTMERLAAQAAQQRTKGG